MIGQAIIVIATMAFVALGLFGLLRAWKEAKAGRGGMAVLLAALAAALLIASLGGLFIELVWLLGPYGQLSR